MRIYLDSNVFISWINQEIDNNFRSLFAEAELFFGKAREQNVTLVLSGLFFLEVKNKSYQDKDAILAYFNVHGLKTEIAKEKEKPPLNEFLGKGMHFLDATHAAIAVANNCDCIVTFNIKDFEKIRDKSMVFLPSDY